MNPGQVGLRFAMGGRGVSQIALDPLQLRAVISSALVKSTLG